MTARAMTTQTAVRLPELHSEAFWGRVRAASDLVTWGRGETGFRYTLKARPGPSERFELSNIGPLATAASDRLKPGTAYVRKAALGSLLLHYPVRKFTEAQWVRWADDYHRICAHVPDEVFVDVCNEWLAEVPDHMPSPADLLKRTEVKSAERKLWLANLEAAELALRNWDDEHGGAALDAPKAAGEVWVVFSALKGRLTIKLLASVARRGDLFTAQVVAGNAHYKAGDIVNMRTENVMFLSKTEEADAN